MTALACADPCSPTIDDAAVFPAARAGGGPVLRAQHSGTTNRLQAVSPANADVVWASGLGGTYVVTTDGGRNRRAGVVPGAELPQFRDVHAVSAEVASPRGAAASGGAGSGASCRRRSQARLPSPRAESAS